MPITSKIKKYLSVVRRHLRVRKANQHLFDAEARRWALISDPHFWPRLLDHLPASLRGDAFAREYRDDLVQSGAPAKSENPLEGYFDAHMSGHGIFKWRHYFEIYDRHFNKFLNKPVKILEIGVYSGGSLEMWRSYFGPKSKIHGIDIEESCKSYENDDVSITIGDQGDRSFWKKFKESGEKFDIIIDDGGHLPHQQRITLEECLPMLNRGGVFFCEDIHERENSFAAYAAGLVNDLNFRQRVPGELLKSRVTPFQRSVHSIHFYPYVLVIEKRDEPLMGLVAEKKGSIWQPFNSSIKKGA